MKVYFFKSDLSQFQLLPEPEDLENFIVIEVKNETDLNNKELVFFESKYLLVEKRTCELSMWDGQKWIVSEDKKAEMLAMQQNEVWEKIKEKRYKNSLGGVYIERIGKWFQTGEEEKTKYLGLDKVIDSLKEIDWKCYDNSFVKMDRTLLNEIFLQMVITENADHINAEKHRAEMMKSEDPLNYDYSQGWSANYEV